MPENTSDANLLRFATCLKTDQTFEKAVLGIMSKGINLGKHGILPPLTPEDAAEKEIEIDQLWQKYLETHNA